MGVLYPVFCDRIKPKQASVESADPELARAVLRNGTDFGILADRLNIVATGIQIDAVDCSFGPRPDYAMTVLIGEDHIVRSRKARGPVRAPVTPKGGWMRGESSHPGVGSAHED